MVNPNPRMPGEANDKQMCSGPFSFVGLSKMHNFPSEHADCKDQTQVPLSTQALQAEKWYGQHLKLQEIEIFCVLPQVCM